LLRSQASLSKLEDTMGRVKDTIRGYIWWMYPRGSVHYDVMVTLILAFIFLAPLWINFRDKPVPRSPQKTEVLVKPEGDGFVYTVDAAALQPGDPNEVEEQLQRTIEGVAGDVRIERVEAVRDGNNKIVAYKAWGHR